MKGYQRTEQREELCANCIEVDFWEKCPVKELLKDYTVKELLE